MSDETAWRPVLSTPLSPDEALSSITLAAHRSGSPDLDARR